MKYFKAEITYELDSGKEEVKQAVQILYCCSPTDFPKSEELRELFYTLDGHGGSAGGVDHFRPEYHTDEGRKFFTTSYMH